MQRNQVDASTSVRPQKSLKYLKNDQNSWLVSQNFAGIHFEIRRHHHTQQQYRSTCLLKRPQTIRRAGKGDPHISN